MNHQFKVKCQLPQGSRLHDGDYSTYKSNTLYYPVKTGRKKNPYYLKMMGHPHSRVENICMSLVHNQYELHNTAIGLRQ